MPEPVFSEEEKMLSVDGEQLDTTIFNQKGKSKGKILFLHGAGESTKERVLPIARELANLRWECMAFSLPGHGASSGELLGSTLQGRKIISQHAAEICGFWPADVAVGVSMGAHTAISFLGDNPEAFKEVVLLVPAAYAREAETVPFGPNFSAVLRTPHSYRTAHSWDILPKYHGKLATLQAGKDEVIPPEIYELIKNSAVNAELQHVYIKDTSHKISFWQTDDPTRIKELAQAIDEFNFSILKKYS